MNIITGYRGEPHITSDQDREANAGSYGAGSYILNVGNMLAADVVSVNEIRIRDGVLSHQGCVGSIAAGTYDSIEISNGRQGMNRNDLIVCRYTKDSETNVEDLTLVVIEGTETDGTASDPEYIDGTIRGGDSPVDFPLYRVVIEGISITSVDQIAAAVRTQAEIDAVLNSRAVKSYTPTWATGQTPSSYHCVVANGICNFGHMGASVEHNAGDVLCTLPEGCRPAQQLYLPFVKMSGGVVGTIRIRTTGVVEVASITSTTTSGRIYFNGTFPV